jgi:hypothetical protein
LWVISWPEAEARSTDGRHKGPCRCVKDPGTEARVGWPAMTDRDWNEFAVEYEVEGVDYLYECGEDETEARTVAETLGGGVLTRRVFETSWLDGPSRSVNAVEWSTAL